MKKTLALLAFLAVLFIACSPAAMPTPAAEGGANASAPGQAQAPTAIPATEVAAAPTATVAPVAQVKEAFVATDPTTVNLAAGKPQLVEFFAFW